MGMGPVEAMVVMEELGRGIVLEPLAQTLVASGVLGAYAPEAVKAAWLPKIASGEALVVLAYQERKARYRLDACEAQATQAGGGWKLSGDKSIVPAGDQADAFLVPARADGKIALFLVERAAQGVSARGYLTMDEGRAAEVSFRDAAATLVCADGLAALEHAVDIGIACACAEGVGAIDRTMQLTAEYLNTRKQFGVPLATFQALRHRMADMKMQQELARSMSYYASLKLNAPAEERRRAMARAKYQLGVAMRFVGQNSVQLHGGIGVTDEYVGSHYFKKLTQLELQYGDTLHHLGEVSERMQDTAGVFA
jgi:alkylation response protein AidB-like acyl-CoA dehydrogenase